MAALGADGTMSVSTMYQLISYVYKDSIILGGQVDKLSSSQCNPASLHVYSHIYHLSPSHHTCTWIAVYCACNNVFTINCNVHVHVGPR
jgi:hypothetical protein